MMFKKQYSSVMQMTKLITSGLVISMMMFSSAVMSDDLSFGDRLLAEENYEKAMKYYWQHATSGNAKAMERYAFSANNLLVAKGLSTAISGVLVYPYYLLAANTGNPEAQKSVCFIAIPLAKSARDLPGKDNITKALSYCVLAARAGNEIAKSNLEAYASDFPPEYFKAAEKLADDFTVIPLTGFGDAPPPSWIDFEL
jgi:hypothetical protein